MVDYRTGAGVTQTHHNGVTFTNLTPHSINLIAEVEDESFTISPSGNTLRLDSTEKTLFRFCYAPEISVHQVTYSVAGELPPMIENHYYIVSALVANAYPDRRDFLMVHKTVRDDNGRIIGCRAFAQA
jgi:hypothetical protein|tara:strand:- start:67 stop:450 length:384 start_codon:yes stop_codon:yes gene_type:complete